MRDKLGLTCCVIIAAKGSNAQFRGVSHLFMRHYKAGDYKVSNPSECLICCVEGLV